MMLKELWLSSSIAFFKFQLQNSLFIGTPIHSLIREQSNPPTCCVKNVPSFDKILLTSEAQKDSCWFKIKSNVSSLNGKFSSSVRSTTLTPSGSKRFLAIGTLGFYPSVVYITRGKGCNKDKNSPSPVPISKAALEF